MARKRRKRIKSAKKARQARKLIKKVARFPITGTKGESPSPRLKTNIVPKLEKNVEKTSETEVINGPDNVTKSKTDPSDEFPEDNLENEDVAIILFNLLELYPSRNLVEAYLYSKLGTNRNNHHTLLNLWDEEFRILRIL